MVQYSRRLSFSYLHESTDVCSEVDEDNCLGWCSEDMYPRVIDVRWCIVFLGQPNLQLQGMMWVQMA